MCINRHLTWGDHTAIATRKAFRMLNLLRRTMYSCSKSLKKLAVSALVRTHLEYCAPAWSPHHMKDINSIERVQKRAAHWTCSKWDTIVVYYLPFSQCVRTLSDYYREHSISRLKSNPQKSGEVLRETLPRWRHWTYEDSNQLILPVLLTVTGIFWQLPARWRNLGTLHGEAPKNWLQQDWNPNTGELRTSLCTR